MKINRKIVEVGIGVLLAVSIPAAVKGALSAIIGSRTYEDDLNRLLNSGKYVEHEGRYYELVKEIVEHNGKLYEIEKYQEV